jgi:hypothetical protein
MVLVASAALVLAGLAELVKDGGLRVITALQPGSPLILHVVFALALLLWWLAACHILWTLWSVIVASFRRYATPRNPEDRDG